MIDWKFITSNCGPIGLDIGHHSIKMIQLAAGRERISVLSADKVQVDAAARDDEEENRRFVISAIRQMLADGKFRGKSVVSCLPSDKLKITSVRLAEAETGEIEQILRKEVAQRFGLDPDKDAVNYLFAGGVQQGNEVKNEFILFAAEAEAVKNHIQMLEQAGLRPAAIDTIPCALFRSFERSFRRHEDRERTAVFVDIGSRFTTVVFGRGEEINFVKHIPLGEEKFNREIASKLNITVDEAETLRRKMRAEKGANAENNGGVAGNSSVKSSGLDETTQRVIIDVLSDVAWELAGEVSLCFRYYTVTFRGRSVEKAIMAGGGAYESILLDILRRQLAVRIEMAHPLRGFDITDGNLEDGRQGPLCEWSVATGLSLKGWSGTNRRAESAAVLSETNA
jgi:type IV pilus assembly protein PilM